MDDDDDDPMGVFWDVENSIVFKAEEFVECLQEELSQAFPARKLEFHAFGVQDVNATRNVIKFCVKDDRIKEHLLPKLKGKDNEAKKDRVDLKLVTDLFVFAMRNRNAPIIILLAGDDDYTKAMETLKDLGFVLASACSANTGGELKKICKQLEFPWDSFKSEESLSLKKKIKTDTDSPALLVPAPQVPAPQVPAPKTDTEVGKVLKEIIEEHTKKHSAPKQAKRKLEHIEGTPMDTLTSYRMLGMFVDVDSIPVKAANHDSLICLLDDYAESTEKILLTTRLIGNRANFPLNSKPTEEDERNQFTSRRKDLKLVNIFMAALGKFIIEYGPRTTIVVMTDNIKLQTMIEGFSDAGINIILVHEKEDKDSDLLTLVWNKLIDHHNWKKFALEL